MQGSTIILYNQQKQIIIRAYDVPHRFTLGLRKRPFTEK